MTPPATMDDAEARSMLLAAADQLFYRNGVGAVSMAEVRDTSGLSMRRLYSLAGSKEELVALWLQYRHDEWTADFQSRVQTALDNGRPPLDAVFDTLAAWLVETDFRGCAFINTHAAYLGQTDAHRVIIRSHKAELARFLTSLLTVASAATGEALAMLVDGAIVHASIFNNRQPVQLAKQAAARLLTQETS